MLQGRCLPYGDGITFWPLVEAVRQAAAIRDDDAPDVALREARDARRRRRRGRRPGGVGDRALRRRLRDRGALLGDAEAVRAARPRAGRSSSLFDDIHWAEPTFLDLIEHLARHDRRRAGAPALHRHGPSSSSSATGLGASATAPDASRSSRSPSGHASASSRRCSAAPASTRTSRPGSSRPPRATRSSSSSSSRCSSTPGCSSVRTAAGGRAATWPTSRCRRRSRRC